MHKIALIVAAALSVSACSNISVDAGHEKVLVMKPKFFGSGGVDETPLKTGTTIVAWSTDDIDVDMQPQAFPLQINDLMSSDGIPLDFDGQATFQVIDSVQQIKQYGEGDAWYKKSVQTELLSYVRDAVKRYTADETSIGNASAKIDDEITTRMVRYLKDEKIPVRLVRVTLGRANPPEQIKNARIASVVQERRVITIKNAGLAEVARADTERKRGEADQAYQRAIGLDPQQFIQLRTLETLKDVCGNKNCTFVQGTGGSIVNLK